MLWARLLIIHCLRRADPASQIRPCGTALSAYTLVLPGWQFRTAYVYEKASAMLPQIGYAWIEWDGTDLVVKPRMFKLPGLKVEGL